MHSSIHWKTGGCLAAWLLGGVLLVSGLAPAQEEPNGPGVAEVLTRGPLHEAFAATVSFDPVAGIVIDQEPPALIEELPPEQRLDGDNVVWIPGYWAWDGELGDFVWISGIWRNVPPGRQWVPGYWAALDGRHQWTSGYWEEEDATEIDYLPKPPRSVEAGPNIQAASEDEVWVPGHWVYLENRYAWRAGSWVTPRVNWVWVPAYYRWTYRGYVFVDGYWDYPVVSRGVVFAPVRFDRGYRTRPGFYYSPSTVISLDVFINHLFVRPSYGHYYFGDYYEPRYRDRGYYPSFSYGSGRRGYDPIYSHRRWEHRGDRNWERNRREYFEYRRDHQDARPPRTWAALASRSLSDRENADFRVAERFDRVVGERRGRFRDVSKQERERYTSQRQEIRAFGKQRQELEVQRDRPKAASRDRVQRVKIDRSPVASKKSGRPGTKGGPPPRLQARTAERGQTKPMSGSKDQKKGDKAGQPAERRDTSRPPGEHTRDDKGRDDKARDDKARDERVAPRPDDRKGGRADARVPRPDTPRQKGLTEAPSRGSLKPSDSRRPESPPRQAAPGQDRQARAASKRREAPDSKRPAAAREAAEPKPKRQAAPPRKEPKPARVQSPEKTRKAAPKAAPRPQAPRAQPEKSKPARPSKKVQPQKSPVPPSTKPEPEKAKEDKGGKKEGAAA